MTYTATYRATDGSMRTTTVEAANRSAALAELKTRGITALSLKEGGAPAASGNGPGWRVWAVCALLATAAALGAWWWFAGGSPTPSRPAPAKPAPEKKHKPVAVAKPPVAPKPQAVPAATNEAASGRHGRRHAPVYDANGKRVFKNPDSPVARSWRSRHGQPPLVDFREKEDPNAPPPRYSNSLQFNLAEFAVPGRATGGADPITDKEAREFLKQKIEFLFDDSEKVLEEKQAVAELQEQLREWMDNGGHAMKFMKMLEARQEKESEAMMEVQKNVMEFCKAGDGEAASAALEKYNAYLESQGMPKMKMTHRMKRALEKAGGRAPGGAAPAGGAQADGAAGGGATSGGR